METMIYLCRAERQGRMIAVAIRPESLYKNECPIEGHPFLPNDKPGILPIHLVGKCERKQGATEKVSYVSVWIENKCSPFQYDFKKLSIVPANETKKRLLKSGKDTHIDVFGRKRRFISKSSVLFRCSTLLNRHSSWLFDGSTLMINF